MLQLNFEKKIVRDSTPILFVLILAFDSSVLYDNDALLIVQVPIKNHNSSFSKKVLIFHNACFRVKTLKMLKNYSDCYIKKKCRSRKRKATLKTPSIVF